MLMRRCCYSGLVMVALCATALVPGCGEGVDDKSKVANGEPFIAKGKLKSDMEAKAKAAAASKNVPRR